MTTAKSKWTRATACGTHDTRVRHDWSVTTFGEDAVRMKQDPPQGNGDGRVYVVRTIHDLYVERVMEDGGLSLTSARAHAKLFYDGQAAWGAAVKSIYPAEVLVVSERTRRKRPETREERILRYLVEYSDETVATMLVEMQDAYQKLGVQLDDWRRVARKHEATNGKPPVDGKSPQDRLMADVEILRSSEPMSEVYHDAQARCLRALPELLGLLGQKEGDLARWERLFLDKPEDRLFHASDKTWWLRRDDSYLGVGALFRAEPPEYVQRMEDDLSFVRTELARVKAEYEELLASKIRALEKLKAAQAQLSRLGVERVMTATATMPAERQDATKKRKSGARGKTKRADRRT